MQSEFTTLFVAMTVVIAVLAAFFFFDKLRHPPKHSARYWALAFVAAALCSVAYFVSAHSNDVWWSVAVGNSTMAFTLGAVWMGCRAFNRRRTFALGVAIICVGVAVASSLPSPLGSKWAGAPEKMIALVLFSALIVLEALRPRLRSFAGAWLLAVTLAVHTIYLACRSVAYFVAGPQSELFAGVFSTPSTTALNLVLVPLGGASLIAIQVQDARRAFSRRANDGHRQRFERLRVFRPRAAGRLDREPRAALLVAEVDLIASLRGAYGVAHANRLNSVLGRALLERVPADALLGSADDRFYVLVNADQASAHTLARAAQGDYVRLCAGLSDASAVSFGIAATVARGGEQDADEQGAAVLDELWQAASAALARGAEIEVGRIVVADL